MSTKASYPISTLLLMACLLGFSACKKDESPLPAPSSTNNPTPLTNHDYLSGNLIEANFRGLITDENNQAISGVTVSMGNSVTHTDADGVWQLIDVMVDSERAYIRAEKDGYFNGSRALTPTDIGFNRAFITLMTAETTGSVSSTTGGAVNHSSGAMVELPADGFVHSNGDAYTGTVDVEMCYLDPSDIDILDQMPGNLTALESDDDFVALLTYGMIGVNLVSPNGEALQIAPGANAEIRIPVPTGGLSAAPATIPLWHFDEEDGIWKEDGSAEMIGNEYVGTVSHFSFWNYDVPTDFIFLDGHAYGEDGTTPIQGVQVVIISQGFGNGYAYTDQEGYFGGIIPANEPLTMEVFAPCGSLLSSQEIGPFSSDVTIPVIAVFSDEYGIITGNLMDCGGEPGQGYVTVTNYGYLPESVEVSADGSFALTYGCPPQDVDLIGYSYDYMTNSGVIPVTTIPGETVDIGTVDLCAFTTDEYIVFTVAGEMYTVVDSIWVVGGAGQSLQIIGFSNSAPQNTSIVFEFTDTPDPAASDFADSQNVFAVGQTLVGNLDSEVPIMDWNFSSYSTTPGDYLEFTFTATYLVQDNGVEGPEVITGYGRVQRD